MVGEAGADTYVFAAGDGDDWIDDFDLSEDKIGLSALTTFNDFSDVLAAANEWVRGSTWINFGGVNNVRLEGISIASLDQSKFYLRLGRDLSATHVS